jgi:hypothetical protein
MLEKFKSHFKKLNPRKFVVLTVLTLIATDLINGYYLMLYWAKKDYGSILMQESIRRGGMSSADFNSATLNEMHGFMDNLFHFFLFIILANNLFFYFFYLRKRQWAQGFVAFYTLTAALFSLTLLFDNGGLGVGWYMYNLATIPYYLYLFMGVRTLKEETTL